jgi:hypothetical protein
MLNEKYHIARKEAYRLSNVMTKIIYGVLFIKIAESN